MEPLPHTLQSYVLRTQGAIVVHGIHIRTQYALPTVELSSPTPHEVLKHSTNRLTATGLVLQQTRLVAGPTHTPPNRTRTRRADRCACAGFNRSLVPTTCLPRDISAPGELKRKYAGVGGCLPRKKDQLIIVVSH